MKQTTAINLIIPQAEWQRLKTHRLSAKMATEVNGQGHFNMNLAAEKVFFDPMQQAVQ